MREFLHAGNVPAAENLTDEILSIVKKRQVICCEQSKVMRRVKARESRAFVTVRVRVARADK